MKQPKKLLRNQKIILDKMGKDSKQYMLISDSKDSFVIGKKPDFKETQEIKY